MARTKTQQSVSLFPFLAVLICTMGALILVLLLTTRQIRDQVAQAALEEQQAAVLAEVPAASQPAQPSADDSVRSELSPAAAVETEAAATADAASVDAATVPAATDVSPDETPAVDVAAAERSAQIEAATLTIADTRTALEDLQSRIGRATADREQLARQHTDLVASTKAFEEQTKLLDEPSDLEEQAERVAELKQQLQARNSQKADQSEKLKALYGDLDEASETTRRAEQLLHRRESALIELRELADKADQQPAVGTDATLLEFTNSSGTTQFPVIIELNSAGLVFQPSGVVIRTADLEGFTPRESPLVAGILAAHNAQPSRSLMERPYALLLVRPEGSLAFYSVQRILRGAQIHFGYELLESDRRVAIETPAWDERSEIVAAIKTSMQRRQQLYGDLVNRINELKRQAAADGQRRLTVGPDGQLREQDERVADLLPGRFYAGGVAPPPGFQQRREQQRRSTQPVPGGPSSRYSPPPELARGDSSGDVADEQAPQTGQLQPGETVVRLPAAGGSTEQSSAELDRLLAILEENGTQTSRSDRESGASGFTDPAFADSQPAGGPTIVNPFIDAPQIPAGTDSSASEDAAVAARSGMTPHGSATSGLTGSFNDTDGSIGIHGRAADGPASGGPPEHSIPALSGVQPPSSPQGTEERLSPDSTPLDWSNSVAAHTDSNSRTVAAAANEEFPSSPIAPVAPAAPGVSATVPQGAVTSAAPSATTQLNGAPNMSPGSGQAGSAPVDPALAALQRFLSDAERQKADARPNPYLVDLMTGTDSRTVRVPVDVRLQGNLLQVGNLDAVDTSQMSSRQLLDATLNGISTQLSSMPDGGRTAVPVLDFHVDQVAATRLPELLQGLQQLDVPTRAIERTETPPGTFLELLKKNATLGPAAAPINIRPPQTGQGRIRL